MDTRQPGASHRVHGRMTSKGIFKNASTQASQGQAEQGVKMLQSPHQGNVLWNNRGGAALKTLES